MVKIEADALTVCIHALATLGEHTDGQQEFSYEEVAVVAGIVKKLAERMELPLVPLEAQGLINALERRVSETKARADTAHLAKTLMRLLSGYEFLYISASKAKYYTADIDEVFGSDVVRKLEGSNFDMVEASKCFALDRFTACVHHLMKIVERSLRQFASDTDVNPIKSPSERPKEWIPLVAEIRAKVMAGDAINDAERRKKQDRLLALDRFENIVAARHRVAHPDEKYTEEEALACFGHVTGFLEQLVKAM